MALSIVEKMRMFFNKVKTTYDSGFKGPEGVCVYLNTYLIHDEDKDEYWVRFIIRKPYGMSIIPIVQITKEYIFFEKPSIELISLDIYTSALQATFNVRCAPSTTNLHLGIKWTVVGKCGKKYVIYSSSGLYIYTNGDIRAQKPAIELTYDKKRKKNFENRIQKIKEELLIRIKLGALQRKATRPLITNQELYNALCMATPDDLKSYEQLYNIALNMDHNDPIAGFDKLIDARKEALHMYAGSLHYVEGKPICLHMTA